MAIYYFDSSAIVKYFHNEPGSPWIRQRVKAPQPNSQERANAIYIGSICIAEVPAAFAILRRTQQISEPLRDRMYRAFFNAVESEWAILPVTLEILYVAARLTQQYPLKGYDAIQLAVALDFATILQGQNISLTFVASDNTLLQAARAEGMATENPFDHSDLDTAQ